MIYFAILTLNILFVYFIKSDNKYWLLSIPFWILLFSTFIYWRTNSDREIQTLETQYWSTLKKLNIDIDIDEADKIEQLKKQARAINMTFIYAIGLQTLLTFALQIIGHIRTKRKLYRWSKIIFGILFALVFFLIAMMGIVPSGGIIG